MDKIKSLLKDVLYKIQDIPDVPFTTVRMSDIASVSSLSPIASRSVSEQNMSQGKNPETMVPKKDFLGLSSSSTKSNNQPMENETYRFSSVYETKKDIKSTNSSISNPDILVTDISWTSQESHTYESKQATYSSLGTIVSSHHTYETINECKSGVKSHESLDCEVFADSSVIDGNAVVKTPQSKIIMGRRALMKKNSENGDYMDKPFGRSQSLVSEYRDFTPEMSRRRSEDLEDSAVVHTLVHDKYYDKMSHYMSRMSDRRLSRGSESLDDGNCSVYSTGSLKTSGCHSGEDGSNNSLFSPLKSSESVAKSRQQYLMSLFCPATSPESCTGAATPATSTSESGIDVMTPMLSENRPSLDNNDFNDNLNCAEFGKKDTQKRGEWNEYGKFVPFDCESTISENNLEVTNLPTAGAQSHYSSSVENLGKSLDRLFTSTTNNIYDATDLSTEYEFDPTKFLQLAGISSDNYSMNASLNSSRLQHSQSTDQVNGPSIFNRAGSLYNTFRKSLRKACSFREKNSEREFGRNKDRPRIRCQSYLPLPEYLGSKENLERESLVQSGIIFQVSKALALCRNSNDTSSREYIEAEKILLVALRHKQAIQSALDGDGLEDDLYSNMSGTLEISDVTFYMKPDQLTSELDDKKASNEYFVIVVTSGTTVLSSKVLEPAKNGEIKSDRNFKVAGLQTDYDVSVAIYSLKVKQTEKSKKSDSKHHKKERKAHCPSSRGLFHFGHKSSHNNLLVENASSLRPSAFTQIGSSNIRCTDMEKNHFRMCYEPLDSSLEGFFTANLTVSDLKLTNRKTGFLTVGFEDKCHLVWNERWCVLEGSNLKYWNYPSEEFSSNPVGSIDLAHAINEVAPADRSHCPRPKSLSLLIQNSDGSSSSYFLSASNKEEKEEWLEELNFVIGTLRSWNLLYSKVKVSDI